MTTYYIGNHYEVKSGVVTKYYFAGSTRLAVRTNGTLSYLLGDHIGSSSVTTDANGVKTASALYKAFGETRYTLGNLGTDYKFTGQREEASLGIYFFNARWMDPSLGRFTSPDTIVPTSTQGTQAWDRYAFVNNNPVRYSDPTGHSMGCDPEDHTCEDEQGTVDELDEIVNNQNPSSCSQTEDVVECEIYIPEDALDEVDNLLAAVMVGAAMGYEAAGLLIGAAIGALVGAIIGGGVGSIPMSAIGAAVGALIGTILAAGASAYEGITLWDLREEIHASVETGGPLVIYSDKNIGGVWVNGDNDNRGVLVNSPFAFLAVDSLVYASTGDVLVPTP